MVRPLPICGYCQKTSHTQQNYRRANGLCLACGSSDHLVEGYPHKKMGMATRALPALLASTVQRNPAPVVRKAPLPPQQQVFCQVQKRTRATEKDQAYNLTVEVAKTSEEVVVGKIIMHSKSIPTLFDSNASHCFISDSFIALYSIPIVYLDNL